jgi:hypothetical protein
VLWAGGTTYDVVTDTAIATVRGSTDAALVVAGVAATWLEGGSGVSHQVQGGTHGGAIAWTASGADSAAVSDAIIRAGTGTIA